MLNDAHVISVRLLWFIAILLELSIQQLWKRSFRTIPFSLYEEEPIENNYVLDEDIAVEGQENAQKADGLGYCYGGIRTPGRWPNWKPGIQCRKRHFKTKCRGIFSGFELIWEQWDCPFSWRWWLVHRHEGWLRTDEYLICSSTMKKPDDACICILGSLDTCLYLHPAMLGAQICGSTHSPDHVDEKEL